MSPHAGPNTESQARFPSPGSEVSRAAPSAALGPRGGALEIVVLVRAHPQFLKVVLAGGRGAVDSPLPPVIPQENPNPNRTVVPVGIDAGGHGFTSFLLRIKGKSSSEFTRRQ
jgi:hypothetical protein